MALLRGAFRIPVNPFVTGIWDVRGQWICTGRFLFVAGIPSIQILQRKKTRKP
jgi:hypothetical protein